MTLPVHLTESIAKASFNYYSSFDDAMMPDLYSPDPLGPADDVWGRFILYPDVDTPPGSPQRDENDAFSLSYSGYESHMDTMPTSELFDCEQRMTRKHFKDPVLQDCMWSGAERRPGRVRNVSLSELSMVTASTSCIDPTTFTAYPRQHNQVEHNYSLATPEPMRVPKIYSNYNTPSTSENSESEEDVIDVVTVDTSRIITHTYAQSKSNLKTSSFRVRHNLQEVAQRLSTHPYNRPKCLIDNINKKPKQLDSSSHSLPSSFSGSDCEEYGVKRSTHNVMERKRRSELRQHLHKLRDQLPMKSDRPAKVMILVRARDAIQQLESEDRHFRQEYKRETQQNARLKQRLAELQSRLESCF